MNDCLRSKPPLFIDTCALDNKDFIKWLKDYRGTKSISPVVYMEYCTYLLENGCCLDQFDEILRRSSISIVQFNREQARNAAMMMSIPKDHRCPCCHNLNWNDCMIAANTPYAPTILVTKNIKDFEQFIDWKGRLKTPTELMS